MMCACDGIILFLMGTLYPVHKGIIEKKNPRANIDIWYSALV